MTPRKMFESTGVSRGVPGTEFIRGREFRQIHSAACRRFGADIFLSGRDYGTKEWGNIKPAFGTLSGSNLFCADDADFGLGFYRLVGQPLNRGARKPLFVSVLSVAPNQSHMLDVRWQCFEFVSATDWVQKPATGMAILPTHFARRSHPMFHYALLFELHDALREAMQPDLKAFDGWADCMQSIGEDLTTSWEKTESLYYAAIMKSVGTWPTSILRKAFRGMPKESADALIMGVDHPVLRREAALDPDNAARVIRERPDITDRGLVLSAAGVGGERDER